MSGYAPFGDIEVALMEYLDAFGYTVTSTPFDLKARLPVLRIRCVGGADSKQSDEPRVSVQSFTARNSTAPRAGMALAEQIRARMLSLSGVVVAGVRLDTARTSGRPIELPYPDPDVNVVEAIYAVSARR